MHTCIGTNKIDGDSGRGCRFKLSQPLPNECVFVVMKLLNSSLMSVIYYVLPYYMSTINSNVTLPLYVC